MAMQDEFDRALQGVIKQGIPSFDGEACQYLTPETGAKCGVGHLLPDDETRIAWDFRVGALTDYGHGVDQELAKVGLTEPVEFYIDLQRAHDKAQEKGGDFLADFRFNMAGVAKKWGLAL